MAITEKQRQDRIKGLGASDIVAILGHSKYRGPREVWMEKTGQYKNDGEMSEAAEIGTMFEEPIRSIVAKRMGRRVVAPKSTLWHPGGAPIFANLDGMLDEFKRGQPCIEVKAGRQCVEYDDPEKGVDALPESVIVQCHVQCACAESPEYYVAAFGRGFGLSIDVYGGFKPDLLLTKRIIDAATEWWEKHVVKGVPPAEGFVDREMAAAVQRVPGKVVKVNPLVMDAWRVAKAACEEAEAHEKKCRGVLEAAMGDAEAADGGDAGSVTYTKTKDGTKFDAVTFQAQHPQLWDKFQIAKPGYRVMRWKAAKNGGAA